MFRFLPFIRVIIFEKILVTISEFYMVKTPVILPKLKNKG